MRIHSKMPSDNGFTLVELMITVAVSGILAVAVSWAYTSQQRVYRSQEAVIDIQQNARAGLYLLAQELRMAGYDPQGSSGASITNATNTTISFTQDLDGDGNTTGPNENVTLTFIPGIGGAPGVITRDDGTGAQPFIDNVDNLEFAYTVAGVATMTLAPPGGALDEIRTIQASMLIRSSIQEKITNTLFFTTGFGTFIPAFNDEFRRRMLTTVIQCRNAAL